jgi:uncharacterized protein YyaL (SSP411 family)
MANHLAGETSPYLTQHADNPVDWYPWGPEALERARREDKPILLSVGYAACHWCHVMAHESFEDAETARVMNELFVNVKVDREERPDIDTVYMQAVQSITGQGGWPMTVFLTPDGEPFYAGTYFPPVDRHGMPSFRRVLASVADAYVTKKDRVARTAAAVREIYAAAAAPADANGTLNVHTLERAYRGLARRFDERHGGFDGGAGPKFPQAMALDFALRHWMRTGTEHALQIAHRSFRAMAEGGVYDQVGGGFHRYSVDSTWLVPHFEKMLYDNALLARLGVHLWQATQDAAVRRVTEETLDWVRREMTAPAGGFYSTLDADSEGHEGLFYLWTESELDAALGPDSALVKAYYGVTPQGNFEGRNILFVPAEASVVSRRANVTEAALMATVARAKRTLAALREGRVRPARDEKILAAWNGLLVRAVAEAALAFDRPDYRELAIAAGEFLQRTLVDPHGRVMRSHTQGVTRIAGYLDDHASIGLADVSLYELTGDAVWLDRARKIADAIDEWFWDESGRAYFDTARDSDALIARPRDVTDNAVPSGTSLVADLMLSLAQYARDDARGTRGTWILTTMAEPMAEYPTAFGYLLGVADRAVHGAAAEFVCRDGVCEVPGTAAD